MGVEGLGRGGPRAGSNGDLDLGGGGPKTSLEGA
jgi:hypothetical protein